MGASRGISLGNPPASLYDFTPVSAAKETTERAGNGAVSLAGVNQAEEMGESDKYLQNFSISLSGNLTLLHVVLKSPES